MATAAPLTLLGACADPTRLRLLRILGGGELCVCHLVEILGLPQPTVSRHLASLRAAGLVKARKEGLWCHYSLARARGGFHASLLECLERCEGETPELAADAIRERRLRRSLAKPGCCPRKPKESKVRA